jgi:hypothetical protein
VKVSIPHRIIQTARDRRLSPLAEASALNLQLLHPGWEYVFFDDAAIRRFVAAEFPQYLSCFEGFARPIQRIDFFRYLAIYREGGFYFDLDVLLRKPLLDLCASGAVFPFEELTLSRHLRAACGIDWEIGNYAFGASPGHPFLLAVVENCVRAQRDPQWVRPMLRCLPRLLRPEFEVLVTTGPGLVTRTWAELPPAERNVNILFPENVCDPAGWHQFGDYGVHLMDGSWRLKPKAWRQRLARHAEARLQRRMVAESRRAGGRRAAQAEGKLAHV